MTLVQQIQFSPPKRKYQRFTAEEIAYIREQWAANAHARDIAAALGRSEAVIRQAIFHKSKDLRGLRSTLFNKLRTRTGLDLAAPPTKAEADRAAQEFVRLRREAVATARREMRERATAIRHRALTDMRAAIVAGTDRNEAIFNARSAGAHLEEIANEFGITRERVRQICYQVSFRRALADSLKSEAAE